MKNYQHLLALRERKPCSLMSQKLARKIDDLTIKTNTKFYRKLIFAIHTLLGKRELLKI